MKFYKIYSHGEWIMRVIYCKQEFLFYAKKKTSTYLKYNVL